MGHPATPRRLAPALWRGWCRRCPGCGRGRLFSGFLTLRPACPACGEALHHARADDGPAWLSILIVGHLMASAMLAAFLLWQPHPLTMIAGLGTGCVALSLWLLPRLKGGIVALQWAQRLHGFGEAP
jgi:uncharacterized protein (DUF983 family)